MSYTNQIEFHCSKKYDNTIAFGYFCCIVGHDVHVYRNAFNMCIYLYVPLFTCEISILFSSFFSSWKPLWIQYLTLNLLALLLLFFPFGRGIFEDGFQNNHFHCRLLKSKGDWRTWKNEKGDSQNDLGKFLETERKLDERIASYC